MTAAAAAGAFTLFLGQTAYRLTFCVILPLIGLFEAYFVVRRGINCYLSWILPPIGMALGHLIVYGHLPSDALGCLLCALACIIGGAAGDVKNREEAGKCRNKTR